MINAQKEIKIHFNNEDTKNESSLEITNKKYNNFFNALKEIKNTIIKNKPHLPILQSTPALKSKNNTLGDTELSEYSKTNAHFSREEHERYIIEKVINISHNNIKQNHKRSNTSANIPYKMIVKPMLSKIIEECNEDDKINHSTKRKNKKILITSTACDTRKNLEMSQPYNSSFIIKDYSGTQDCLNNTIEKCLALNLDKIKIDDLNDLDEIKEINMLDYKNEDMKKLNISKLDLSEMENKNSKILIIESEIYSNNSNNSNNMSKKLIGKKINKNIHLTEESLRNLKKRENTINEENPIHFNDNDSLDFKIDGKFFNTSDKKRRILSITSKKMRTKYLKSEIFEFNNKSLEIHNMEKLNYNLLKDSQKLETKLNINQSNQSVKRNLLSYFNRTSQDFYQSFPTSQEFDLKTIELITDHTREINTSDIFKTPEQKVKKTNIVKNKRRSLNFSQSSTSTDEKEESVIYTVFDIDFIKNLLARENHYRPNHDYIKYHPRLKEEYRTVLLDWIMELCEEFAFKRDTFHYTVNYIDRFLSKGKNFTKASLQLIGIACLSIAAKFEEVTIPKVEEYINATDNIYQCAELITMEKYILKVLKWEIMPSTINTWLNWYMCQWDLFIDSVPSVKLMIFENNKHLIYFKKTDEDSYQAFRELTQLIDICTIDYDSMKFNSRIIVGCAIFILLCLKYDIEFFRRESINMYDFGDTFWEEFIYEEGKHKFLINLYGIFLEDSFNLKYSDLIETLVYLSRFLQYEYNYDLPLIMQTCENAENGNYEDLLSFQTHNKRNYEYLFPNYSRN